MSLSADRRFADRTVPNNKTNTYRGGGTAANQGTEQRQYMLPLNQPGDDEETMEDRDRGKASNIDTDAEAFISPRGAKNNQNQSAAISTPGGRGEEKRRWRTPSYDINEGVAAAAAAREGDDSPLSGLGKESEEAQRRQWEDVERQQQRELGGSASSSSFGKARNSPAKRVPPSPTTSAPVGGASPYAQLNMAHVQKHAKRRMNAAGGDSDGDASTQASEEDDDAMLSSMTVQKDV